MSSELEEPIDRTTAGNLNNDKKLVSVLVPAVVNDVQKALHCLGGLNNISEVYCRGDGPGGRRLGLSFSPDNPLAHNTFADAKEGGGILYRVRVRRHRKTRAKSQVLSCQIEGFVTRMYTFDCLLDFTIAPVSDGECIQEKLMPAATESISWITEPAPVLLPPPYFSRSDRPLQYGYTEKKQEIGNTDLHDRVRQKRGLDLLHPQFSLTETLPTAVNPEYIRALNSAIAVDPKLNDKVAIIDKAFSERPIWSRNAIHLHTGVSWSALKFILPARALYLRSGPWRFLWTGIGYDARLNPEARWYQTLDFRMRNAPEIKVARSSRKNKGVQRVKQGWGSEKFGGVVSESSVIFKPGVLPSQRQIYFQYCDIHVEEVKRLVEEGVSQTCDVVRGWLRPGVESAVRDEITRLTRVALHKLHGNVGSDEAGPSSPSITD